MQTLVDEWASSLFQVGIVFLYFHINDVLDRVCVIAYDRELRRSWMRARKCKEELDDFNVVPKRIILKKNYITLV